MLLIDFFNRWIGHKELVANIIYELASFSSAEHYHLYFLEAFTHLVPPHESLDLDDVLDQEPVTI